MRIRFWGVRGTIPTPGAGTLRLGGNTACLDILTSDDQVIILDAGTGIRNLGKALQKAYSGRVVGTMLISHTHWDHIQGFPFFAPNLTRHNRFVVLGQQRIGRRLEQILAGQIVEPYLPFGYKQLLADLLVKEIKGGESVVVGNETVIRVAELWHPGGCLGFRIENNGAILTYCTDCAHRPGQLNPQVIELARGADLLVHDAQFTPEEAETYPTWGHSSWQEATQVADQAQVKQLALFHYAPDASDDEMEVRLIEARKVFPQTILSYEGLEMTLPHLPR
ncbi:MAG: MBL fold metallo-hydrolase [Chloroflexota bacterium]